MKIEFTKMEGLGNDYIYVDAVRFPVADPATVSIKLSDRHFGIGGDGLVVIGPSRIADFSMRMYNADGSEGLMCGNAARCIGKLVYEKGLTDKKTIELETASGVRTLQVHTGSDGLVESVTVGMGSYSINQEECAVVADGVEFTGTKVNVGNPHFVIFVPNADAVDIHRFGPVIEHSFPGGVNVEFATVKADSHIRMRVWERGSGPTLACGTGACATSAAAVSKRLCQSPCTIDMDGGSLQVSCDVPSRSILMRGPARIVFEGQVEV